MKRRPSIACVGSHLRIRRLTQHTVSFYELVGQNIASSVLQDNFVQILVTFICSFVA